MPYPPGRLARSAGAANLAPMPPFASLRQEAHSPLLQVLKTSVAAIIAWVVSAIVVQEEAPIFAAIAALLVVQPSVTQSLAKGIERSLGVVIGVALAFTAGLVFGSSSWVILGAIVVSLLVAWVLRLSPGSSNQIPISAMLVLAIGAQTPAYALERIVETIIGAVAGLAVNAAIVPPVLTAPARLAILRLTGAVADTFDDLAGVLARPTSPAGLSDVLSRARGLRPLHTEATEKLEAAVESLALNPRAGAHRDRLAEDKLRLERLSALVSRTIGMARAVHDNGDDGLHADPIARAIAGELGRAAHDIRLLSGELQSGSRSTRADSPIHTALTAPIAVVTPDPQNWILLGSLLEDLRRVREEIIGNRDA